MAGTAVVTVGINQWEVSVASTPSELLSGLSGVVSIPANTGILFDMGSNQEYISVNMADMLFKLDIVFISGGGVVVGVLHGVAPGESVAFDAGNGASARYFMEVNEDEMDDVSVGDTVIIDIASTNGALDINAIIGPLITVMIVGMMMKMMTGAMGNKSVG